MSFSSFVLSIFDVISLTSFSILPLLAFVVSGTIEPLVYFCMEVTGFRILEKIPLGFPSFFLLFHNSFFL